MLTATEKIETKIDIFYLWWRYTICHNVVSINFETLKIWRFFNPQTGCIEQFMNRKNMFKRFYPSWLYFSRRDNRKNMFDCFQTNVFGFVRLATNEILTDRFHKTIINVNQIKFCFQSCNFALNNNKNQICSQICKVFAVKIKKLGGKSSLARLRWKVFNLLIPYES